MKLRAAAIDAINCGASVQAVAAIMGVSEAEIRAWFRKPDSTPKAPFPWFGGKSRVADLVWSRFGAVKNYVEPFFGSGAVLLGRPQPFTGSETVNDLDGFVANFWRAVRYDPDVTAAYADENVNENDLHARHVWLLSVRDNLRSRLEADPEYCDPKIAGWWVWGLCCWIGSGWCSGRGPWSVVGDMLVRSNAGQGVNRQLPHLGNAGRGVNRKLPHLGNAGRGVNRKLPHLGDAGRGVNRQVQIAEWFETLSRRFDRVRVCSGDWSRVCGPSVTHRHGLTGIFLDPPYSDSAGRKSDLYSQDSASVSHAVRDWAVKHGQRNDMRIALCGYDGEHDMPTSWECVEWKAAGGYGSQAQNQARENSTKERVWFSPACLTPCPQAAKI